MDILQKADQVGKMVKINDTEVPVILNREFEAQVSVPDRGTVALGGLVNTDTHDTVTKIPILGDIPFIGRYLFSSVSKSKTQRELVVLLTPYVMTSQKELLDETRRRYDSIDMNKNDWPQKGWSDSTLSKREKPDDKKKK
jgi:type II secretory pathway component GspD/PulD (secretin)